jgi:hypothetical protein
MREQICPCSVMLWCMWTTHSVPAMPLALYPQEGPQTAATDMVYISTSCTDVTPQVTAKDVGLPKVIKVWHDNTGRHPDWFLEYVRVRKRAGKATPGPAPVSVGSPRADPAAVRLQHTGEVQVRG